MQVSMPFHSGDGGDGGDDGDDDGVCVGGGGRAW